MGGEWVYSYVVGASSGAQVALRCGVRCHLDGFSLRLCRSIVLLLSPLLFCMIVIRDGIFVNESRNVRKHSTKSLEPFNC